MFVFILYKNVVSNKNYTGEQAKIMILLRLKNHKNQPTVKHHLKLKSSKDLQRLIINSEVND